MAERKPDIDAVEVGLDALNGVRELLVDIAGGSRQFDIVNPDHLATLIGLVADTIARALGKPT